MYQNEAEVRAIHIFLWDSPDWHFDTANEQMAVYLA